MSKETWKPVVGYDDRYQVSSHGRVRSKTGRILKINYTTRYPFVVLYSGSRSTRKNHRVHILVARAFLGEPPPKHEVRHLDGDVTNIRLENLKYGTSGQNKQDTVAHGRHHNAIKTQCPAGHDYDESNTYWHDNKRQCRKCHIERTRTKRHGPSNPRS